MLVAKAFTRLFHRPEADIVLAYLKRQTQERVLPPDSTDAELRFLEGQRALFAKILSLIQQGQNKGD